MALPGLGPSAAVSASNTASSPEDPNKKVRKPYTITKSRESWTDPEHDKFLEALQLFDRDWKKIEAFIGSKTVIQIRSHAQKYFLKVQKNGTSEHLPPPRPKRKASHPYPQKAPKNGSVPAIPQISRATQSSSDLTLWSPLAGAAISSPTSNAVHTVNLSNAQSVTNNCCSSIESTPGVKLIGETTDLANHNHRLRVLPDFAQVYSFIGSVFDPDATDHLQKLKKMDRIDVETVLLLMRNLSINLTSPDFEDHRRLLSSYEIESETINLHGATTTVGYDQPQNVA